jgi:hypothetical protein
MAASLLPLDYAAPGRCRQPGDTAVLALEGRFTTEDTKGENADERGSEGMNADDFFARRRRAGILICVHLRSSEV